MRRRRRLIIALAVLLVVAALAAVVVLRKKAPPESVQLLPDAEAVVHVNFRLMRLLGAMEGFSESVPEEEFKTFVEETGIRFERDLDEMAMAVHAPPPTAQTGAATGDKKGARGKGSRTGEAATAEAEGETRFSHVFIGRFDSAKLAAYLKKLAVASETYRDLEVLLIPSEGRTVRTCILGVDTVAVSNAESGQPIHDIIDHYKARAAPYGGPELVREYYKRVPRGSLVWAMARWSEAKPVALGGPLELTLPRGVAWVGSLRFLLGDMQLRVEAHTGSEAEARQVSDQLTNLLTLYRNLWGAQVADPDLQALIQSVEVRQEQQRAVVTASLSRALLKKAMGEPAAPPAPAVEEKPAGQ